MKKNSQVGDGFGLFVYFGKFEEIYFRKRNMENSIMPIPF